MPISSRLGANPKIPEQQAKTIVSLFWSGVGSTYRFFSFYLVMSRSVTEKLYSMSRYCYASGAIRGCFERDFEKRISCRLVILQCIQCT